MAFDSRKEEAWVRFAAAITSQIRQPSPDAILLAAAVADRMLDQWSARFGDAAMLLDGQEECAACHKPLPPGSEFTPSVDGVKFCNIDCLKGSGREE